MRQNRKNWSHDEDETIISLVRKYGTKRWTLISEKMKERFPDDGRSGKQCRERWHNHLSPIINKQPWSQEEIKLVFDSHRRFGNKWTQIAQLLPGRTDNAVKNQFYSTLRKGLRRICKILGTRNSTTRIKKIKPTSLSNLISNFTEIPADEEDNEYELYDMLFQFSNGDKYQELKEKEVTEKYKEKMERLLEKILDSKESGRKRRIKASQKHLKITNRNQQKMQMKQQSSSSQSSPQQKQQEVGLKIEPDNQFVFNVDLDENEDDEKYGNQNRDLPFPEINQMENAQEQFDWRLEKPISLKRENSLAESMKDEDNIPGLKKRFSQTQRVAKKNYLQIENSENLFQSFLSKSPNFSSRIKMPTPRINQNFHSLMFANYDHDNRDQDGEKYCNNVVEQVKLKIESTNNRRDKERLR